MRCVPLLLLLVFACTCVRAQSQSRAQLEQALSETKDQRERYGILYQLTRDYTTSSNFRDADRGVEYGEDAYNVAKRLGDQKLMAASAYATAQAYERAKNTGRQETWLKNTVSHAMKTGNVDLILNATAERTRLATRKQKYRDAVKFNQEALDYFTRDGNDIETLRARLEQEEAGLKRRRREVEQATAALAGEVRRLNGEKQQLENQNENLANKNETLAERNSRTKAALAERARQLEATEEAKAEVEARVETSRQEIQSLSREALQQRALNSQIQEELAREELTRKEAELAATEAEMQVAERSNQRNLAIGVGGVLALLALTLLYLFYSKTRAARKLSLANDQLDEARQQSDELLENILPVHIAQELKTTGEAKAARFPEATVLFCDFVNFTAISEQLGAEALVKELDVCFRAFDDIMDRYEDVEKIKTIGDAYMVASGLTERKSVPNDIVRAALDMQATLRERGDVRSRQGLPYFTARIGLHTGPVVAGVVGARKFAYDIWGDTVNVAARVEGKSEPGRVNLSETTYHLVKYRFDCQYRGKLEAKNKGLLDMYFVEREVVGAATV